MRKLTAIFFVLITFSSFSQKQTRQTVNIYDKKGSVVNSYATFFIVKNEGNSLDYIYKNTTTENTKSDEFINVNDLFQLLNDTLAAYNYDTCYLNSSYIINVKGETYQIKKYNFHGMDMNGYISFNEEYGILFIDFEQSKIDFGTKISSYLKEH